MRNKYLFYIIFLISLIGLYGFTFPFSWLFSQSNNESVGSHAWIDKQIGIITRQAPGLNTAILKLSLNAYTKVRKKGYDNKQLLTVIDYSKPSTEKRLRAFDLKHNRLLMNTWVSHGRNSGGLMATSFSNSPGSLKSSLGVFVTDSQPYQGGNGYSLRLMGLEPGINNNAYSRNVVVHGAWYVNPDAIRKNGQAGRSWGCPAVSENLVKPLIDTIKDNTLVFVYYPDRQWLHRSSYVA